MQTLAWVIEGHRSVLKRIYSCEAYYECVRLYLNRTQPKPAKQSPGQRVKIRLCCTPPKRYAQRGERIETRSPAR